MIPEFSRPIRADTIGTAARALSIAANPAERAALATRFGLLAIDSLSAELSIVRDGGGIALTGKLKAAVVQPCAASGAPVPARLSEAFAILFRPPPTGLPDEEVELGEDELDVVFYDGATIDAGEAVAETLSLALDPFPRAPQAEDMLKAAGVISEEEARPAGALAGLRDLLSGKS